MKNKILTMASAALLLIFNSCDKDDDNNLVKGGGGDIILATTLPNPGGMTGSSYLKLVKEKEGTQTVNNDDAIQIPYGGTYPSVIGKEVFVYPSFIGDTKNKLEKYIYQDNKLQESKPLKLPPQSAACNMIKVSDSKAYLSLSGLGKIMIFNPTTMEKTGEIDLASLGIQDKNPDTSIMLIRDHILYVGLNQMVGGFFSPQDYNQADVALIDTKTEKLIKMISYKGYSMATRPYDPNSIFMDEKGDIYISCLGGFGRIPGHSAGILRIKKGETEFDPTYHWTITGATIEGDTETSSFITSILYTKNGKAYGYVDMPGYAKDGIMANRAVEFDIYNQKMKAIEGVGLSNGFSIMVGKYKNGKLVITNTSETKKGIYVLNPEMNKVDPEPIMKTQGEPMLFHYLN
ncbi:hypothetical protein KRX57_00800 [Weeksellaceae bacterium TAE3-ERU29]|nr:hypothetical protein [Weeksellaceae bacterium TAE3-ERU29]